MAELPRRVIFTRKQEDSLALVSFPAGEQVHGCCFCCTAPSCLPALSLFPCCADPTYVNLEKEAAKYVFLRENSIEYNNPSVNFKLSTCCCIDICQFEVNDNITVIYFDDPIFASMSDKSDCGSSLYSICFGAQGERIHFERKCCYSLCIEGRFPCPIIPICCPRGLCPCYINRDIYTKNAQKAMYEIKKQRSLSLEIHKSILDKGLKPSSSEA